MTEAVQSAAGERRLPEQARPGCCNPVKKSGPVTMEHVLLALRETKEEREARIRGLFNFFDSRNAGYLDYGEIEAGLSALQIPAEYKYAKDLLRVCDANRDGRVDYHEFRRYMDDKELELYRIFQAIDVEHNGCILPEELWEALVKAGILPFLFLLPLIFCFAICLFVFYVLRILILCVGSYFSPPQHDKMLTRGLRE